jgi:hypothetical protein
MPCQFIVEEVHGSRDLFKTRVLIVEYFILDIPRLHTVEASFNDFLLVGEDISYEAEYNERPGPKIIVGSCY